MHDYAVPLTPNDRKVAISELSAISRMVIRDWEETFQARELQVMLFLNLKAEIQAVDDHGDLRGWLDERLSLS